jgi:hypothetical protein
VSGRERRPSPTRSRRTSIRSEHTDRAGSPGSLLDDYATLAALAHSVRAIASSRRSARATRPRVALPPVDAAIGRFRQPLDDSCVAEAQVSERRSATTKAIVSSRLRRHDYV